MPWYVCFRHCILFLVNSMLCRWQSKLAVFVLAKEYRVTCIRGKKLTVRYSRIKDWLSLHKVNLLLCSLIPRPDPPENEASYCVASITALYANEYHDKQLHTCCCEFTVSHPITSNTLVLYTSFPDITQNSESIRCIKVVHLATKHDFRTMKQQINW